MTELWLPVVGYEGYYEVSNIGRVRSVDRKVIYADGRIFMYQGKVLSYNVNKINGALMVHLYKNAKRMAYTVHRLVLSAFSPTCDSTLEVNHKNGNRADNSVDNLEWCTRKENMQHGFRTGLINNTGTNHGNNVYNDLQIIEAKVMLKKGFSLGEIETKTGVKKATLHQIKAKKQWNHVVIGDDL
jgi:hypothetical protein